MASKAKTQIKVIGWGWVILGAISMAFGVADFFSKTPTKSFTSRLALLVFDLLTITSAYMLVRIRPWARVVVQIPIALYAYWSLTNGLHAFQSVLHDERFPKVVSTTAAAFSILVTAIWVGLFIGCIIALNTKLVKTEFGHPNAPIA